jgi:hypothetical protein
MFIQKMSVGWAPVAYTFYLIAPWEAEIRKIKVQGQPGQIVCETMSSK